MTELMTIDVSKYAIMTGPGAQIVRENLAGDQISAGDLPRIKVPAAGGKNWELPNGSSAPTFEGLIMYTTLQKARWEGSEPTPGTPPDCFGRVDPQTGVWAGTGNPGGDCSQCIYNQFGSDANARGKACSDKRLCLIAIPGSTLPVVLYIPAASLKGFKRYLLSLDAPYKHVITRFGLEQDKNQTGIVYSKVVPTKVGNVPEGQIAALENMVAGISSLFAQIVVQAPPHED